MYLAMDQREANLVFLLVNSLCERGSTILAPIKALNNGTIMGDYGDF
ncbi:MULTISPECIES: hypothetical protein [Bacillaceae]|nr:hypothetical protein [Bacillus infantis]MDW2879712.1 hypothetical protein [Bacillus infantis]